MSTLTATQLQQQYIAYFGRPGDPAGLSYWLGSTSGIASAREFADKIYAQDEYKNSTVGDKSVEQQVNSLYVNLFGRDADAAGLIYWTGEIEKGALQLSNVAYDLIWAASNPVSTNSAQATLDATALSNKVSAATAFTADIEASTSAILAYQPKASSPWETGSAFESGVTFLKTATATNAPTAADVDGAITTMVAASASDGSGTSAASTTLKFTTSTDSLVGDSGDDIINGVLQGDAAVANATGTTLAPGDSVDGKDGIDTLSLAVAGDGDQDNDGAYTLNAITTNNVEKFFLSNFDTEATVADGHVIPASLMTGLTTVGLSASGAGGDTLFNGLKNNVDAEMRNGSGDLKLVYDGSYVVTGTADAQKLTVSALTGGTFDADGIETLTVHSELSKSTIAATVSDTLETLNITGDQDLTISTALVFASATDSTTKVEGYVDASAFTGKLTVDVSGSGSTTDVKGGTGDDTLKFAGELTKTDVVDGGAGTDKLTMTAATLDEQFTGVKNIETVAFDPVSGNSGAIAAMDVSKLSAGVTSVELDMRDAQDANAGVTTATITNLGSQTVVLKHTVADATDTNDSDGPKVTITGATDTASDSINITLDAAGRSSGGATKGYNAVDVANFETVNIETAKSTDGVTVTTGEIQTLTATSATSVVLTGAADVFLGSVTGGAMTSFDASAVTGKVDVGFGTNDKITATASATKDTVFKFGTTLNNDDTVVGGTSTKDEVTATLTGRTAVTGKLNLSAIETLDVDTTGTNTLDLSGVTGLTNLELGANKQTITGFDFGTTIVIDDAVGSVKVTAADATGTSDTLKFKTKVDDTAESDTIEAADIENLSITVTDSTAGTDRKQTYVLTKFEGTSVTATEASDSSDTVPVDLGTLHKNTTSIDLSGIKGSQEASLANATSAATITLSGNAAATVTGSAYGDTFTIGKTAAAIVHDITGGDGTDIVNITSDGGAWNPSDLAAETLNITLTAGNDVTLGAGEGFNAASTAITLDGGNSLSTFAGLANANLYLADGVKTFDAGTFGGNITIGVANDKLDDTVTITGGSASTKDSVTVTFATAGTRKPITVGVEELIVSATDGATTAIAPVLDLSNTTGVTKVTATAMDTDTLVIDKATNQSVKVVALEAADSVVEYKLADATGSTDSVTFELSQAADANSIADGGQIKTTDIETVTVKASTGAESISLANLSMTATDATMSLNITGDQALTVSATNADINVIDASGMDEGGSFIQTGRARLDAVTYTGSDGDDTFMMNHKDDAIAAGAGTGDKLVITKQLILGGIEVDLTKTDDVLLTMNGNASSSVQSGFESVDLSNITGTFGAEITAIKGGSTMNGTPNVDIINAGAGADTISVQSQTAGQLDIIKSFTLGTDLIGLDASLTTDATAVGSAAVLESEAAASTQGGAGAYDLDGLLAGDTDSVDIVVLPNAVLANVANADLDKAGVTDGTELLKAIGTSGNAAVTDMTTQANSKFYLATDDGTDGYLYYVTSSGTTAAAADFTLLGKFENTDLGDLAAAQTILFA